MLVIEVIGPFYITDLKCGGQGILVGNPLKATEGFTFFEGERVLLDRGLGPNFIIRFSECYSGGEADLCVSNECSSREVQLKLV